MKMVSWNDNYCPSTTSTTSTENSKSIQKSIWQNIEIGKNHLRSLSARMMFGSIPSGFFTGASLLAFGGSWSRDARSLGGGGGAGEAEVVWNRYKKSKQLMRWPSKHDSVQFVSKKKNGQNNQVYLKNNNNKNILLVMSMWREYVSECKLLPYFRK